MRDNKSQTKKNILASPSIENRSKCNDWEETKTYMIKAYRTSLSPLTVQAMKRRLRLPKKLTIFCPKGMKGMPDPRAMLLPMPVEKDIDLLNIEWINRR